jgi:hypothetical protein
MLVLLIAIGCHLSFHALAPSCDGDSWQCDSGGCVSNEFRCDGVEHCADASDELNCGILLIFITQLFHLTILHFTFL